MKNIGILHPGEMGISVAASAMNSGHHVYWLPGGRSDKTRARAEEQNLLEARSLAELSQRCEILLSVCPPHAAEDVATAVAEAGFEGIFLDANAISPQRSVKIGEMMESRNIRFVDGGIIGGPAWRTGETWLYLSGRLASEIAECFSSGPLGTKLLGKDIGRASALKMCYAAYSKGTTALLAAILAAAERLDVRQELYERWSGDEESFPERANQRVQRVTSKAWRFEGEMKEIAVTFQGAGVPDGFHHAAAEIYEKMAGFRDAREIPSLEEVIRVLLA